MIRKLFAKRSTRRLVLFLCCAGVVGGMGCISMRVAEGYGAAREAHRGTPISNDSIFAVAHPQTSKTVTNSTVIFLGTNKTYLVFEGGEHLTNIVASLAENGLTVHANQSLFRDGNAIWGNLILSYTPPAGLARQAVASNLTSLGYASSFGAPANPACVRTFAYRPHDSSPFTLYIPIKGVVRDDLKVPLDRPLHGGKTYTVSFFNSPESRPPLEFTAWMVLPVTLATDIVLIPVYWLGLILVPSAYGIPY